MANKIRPCDGQNSRGFMCSRLGIISHRGRYYCKKCYRILLAKTKKPRPKHIKPPRITLPDDGRISDKGLIRVYQYLKEHEREKLSLNGQRLAADLLRSLVCEVIRLRNLELEEE